jgi:electron transport complex protein RnfC
MREYPVDRHMTGGLRLAANKAASTARPIDHGFVPRQIVLALRQHRGEHAEPIVEPGQRVRKGQLVGRAATPPSAAVHTPVSGRVRAIEERPVPGGRMVRRSLCVLIEWDGQDAELAAEDRLSWPAERKRQLECIRRAGVVGLGGAVFPTADKLGAGSPCRTLIVNGAECEPHISCDDVLMRESAQTILQGSLVLLDLLQGQDMILAIERDKPEAIRSMSAAAEGLDDARVRIAELPTIYPAGGERQLVEVLTGREVPSGRYPAEIGFPCHNVGTAHAVARLVQRGEPVMSRIVTVTGRGVETPRNVEAPLGTPIAELVARCGGYRGTVERLIHGGSMMGYALPTDEMPVTKATNCVIAATAEEIRTGCHEWPCIRCGECARACPARLLPQELLLAALAEDHEGLQRLSLEDCIECGCCDVTCPSQIPLTQRFRVAKRAEALHRRRLELSELAEQRHRRRSRRQRSEAERDRERRNQLKDEVRAGADARGEAIRAAVERSKRRRETTRRQE